MDWWVVAGTGCLGLTVGWLTFEFVSRAPSLPLKASWTLTTIVGGGAALAVWQFAKDARLPSEANSYFVGVFAAVLTLGLLKYRPED